MKQAIDRIAELEVYKDLVKIGLPALTGLLGGLIGGYFPYRIQKIRILEEKRKETADFNRKLAFELIECFSKFSGSLFSYCSILMSREMNKGTTIDDKVTELGIEMLSNEVHLVKAKAIAGVLGRPELVSKFLTFESIATKTINTLLSSSGDKELALKKLRNQEAELIKALNRLSEL